MRTSSVRLSLWIYQVNFSFTDSDESRLLFLRFFFCFNTDARLIHSHRINSFFSFLSCGPSRPEILRQRFCFCVVGDFFFLSPNSCTKTIRSHHIHCGCPIHQLSEFTEPMFDTIVIEMHKCKTKELISVAKTKFSRFIRFEQCLLT